MLFRSAFLTGEFKRRFGGSLDPALYRAPGRTNLIGEHTDYCLGFVLPVALELACYVAAAPAADGLLRVYSTNLDELREIPVEGILQAEPRRDWSDYVVGVAREIARLGYALRGRDLLIHSTVPVGSGLSSSAALEVSSALALLDGQPIQPLDLALLCQRAEREFVGMPCGIMDQYVSVFAQPGAAVKIDCRSLESAIVPLPGDAAILAVNSMVKHELSGSAYRDRVRECGEAVAALQTRYPEVKSLRDVTPAQLAAAASAMPEAPYRRARHVTTENARVEAFEEASRRGDLKAMGELFVASHRSLQHDYEVSCEELDFLVDSALAVDGVLGARMTGGGFGGCTVNLVRPAAVDAFRAALTARYRERYGLEPEFYECKPSAGAGKL